MDIRQLKYFKTIVDEGNITKAAELLHMAQPPLSQQLKRLEEELGTVLIKRYTHQWELTETGKILYRHAVHMLQDISSIKQEIREMEQGIRGTLSIGVSSSCVNFLPQNVRNFREKYPNVFIKIWNGDSSYLQKLLVEREIELSFMVLPTKLQDYRVRSLPRDPFVVVIPSSWKSRFVKNTVSLKEIIDYPFLMLGPMEGYSVYETILSHFHKHQFSPNIVIECKDISTLLSFVASGIGISIIPKSEIYVTFNQDIKILEIENFSLYIEPAIIFLKQHQLTKAAEHFLNYFTD
ncbi:LysR family transcriptional regulator [Ectobacillus sp. sgz5001026]|uniref:LysR family transcriptional regulator n=1 Tax=Ectobacillus sp. sgz5001026 TaxID=3242473 RepID=UPI0036D219CE